MNGVEHRSVIVHIRDVEMYRNGGRLSRRALVSRPEDYIKLWVLFTVQGLQRGNPPGVLIEAEYSWVTSGYLRVQGVPDCPIETLVSVQCCGCNHFRTCNKCCNVTNTRVTLMFNNNVNTRYYCDFRSRSKLLYIFPANQPPSLKSETKVV